MAFLMSIGSRDVLFYCMCLQGEKGEVHIEYIIEISFEWFQIEITLFHVSYTTLWS